GAVRDLHAGYADDGRGLPEANRVARCGRDSSRAGRQPLPLHGLPTHRPRGAEGSSLPAAPEAEVRGDAQAVMLPRPRTPREALRLLAEHEDALPIAGGTDLMVSWNAGALAGRTFLDVSPLREWARIRKAGDAALVGALASHTDLLRHALVRRRLPLLAEACATVGGVQIQNRGTLGGNIANASPAGDPSPPLAVYEAVVVAASLSGRREIAFADVFTGPKRTSLAPGELIEAVRIPLPPRPPTRQVFRKVGTRAAQAISKTVAAGLLW